MSEPDAAGQQLPDDPLPTVVQQSLIAIHEVFVQLRDAGFTVPEAAAVVAALMTVSPPS